MNAHIFCCYNQHYSSFWSTYDGGGVPVAPHSNSKGTLESMMYMVCPSEGFGCLVMDGGEVSKIEIQPKENVTSTAELWFDSGQNVLN